MKSAIKKITSQFPHSLRKYLTQSALDFSSEISGVQFKLAESIEEFEQAFEILYDSYLRAGYENSNPDKKRIIPQFFLPSTAVLIAKIEDTVIGTMSLVRDNVLGLPMESIFDLSPLRKDGSRLTEISSLAIHPSYRKKGGLLLHQFIRYMWNYALDYHGCEKFVIAVNPAMVQLYEDIYLFKQIPKTSTIGTYNFVQGAPAVGMYINATESKLKFQGEYGRKPQNKDLHNFMFQSSKGVHGVYPEPSEFFDISSSSTSEVLQYFLTSYTDWWKGIDPLIKFKFVRMQCSLGRSSIQYPDSFIAPVPRNLPRYDSLLKIIDHKRGSNLSVTDVSAEGLKIRHSHFDLDLGRATMALQAGPDLIIRMKLEPVWSNALFSGFKVSDADPEWEKLIQFIDSKVNPIASSLTHQKKAI